jgi:hypothetical protein
MKITRFQFFLLPMAATAAGEPKPEVLLKHVGDDNDGGLLQTRFELLPKHEDAIMRVPGVEFCRAHSRYEAALYKGGAFTWAEVEAGVLAVLKGVR